MKQFTDLTDAELEGLRLLGVYTAGRFDVWLLAGGHKASCRAHVMSALLGVKTPQSKSGVNALRSQFYALSGTVGNCEAEREDNFLSWAKQLRAGTMGRETESRLVVNDLFRQMGL